MAESVFDHHCETTNNEAIPLNLFRGKILLIVNTASKCGFTPQFRELEILYKNLRNKGLEILGFPCNQFGKQDQGSINEITQFCELNYGVTFRIFNKVCVNGVDTAPLFHYLKNAGPGIFGTTSIKWNFTKFLVDPSGRKVERFAPISNPRNLEEKILRMLEELE